MTKLFLRFYLGVLAILMISWVIQGYVFVYANQEANVAVVEEALSGGALLARDEIISGGEAEFEQTIRRIKSRFPYPVQVVTWEDVKVPQSIANRLELGEVVLYANRVYTSFPSSKYLLELGPLPGFVGPTGSIVLLGLGAISVLTAVGIALLLRPVVMQLRSVERAALAIAGGDLSARIDGAAAKRSIPISDAFNKMASRVEKALLSQRELLQAVSHEFRTPLARIHFATELGRAATTQPQVQERLASIDEATEQLNDLVGELLTYIKLDQEEVQAEREAVDVLTVAKSAIEQHSLLFPNVAFAISDDSTQVDIDADASAIYRAIGNLISNAGKHAVQKVVVSVRRQADSALVVVDDDGAGIAAEDRESVFEPFKRLADGKPGTGLGLALVQRVCEKMGGTVTIHDGPLGGARFTMELPRQPLDPAD